MLKQQAILTGKLYSLMNVILVICVTTEKKLYEYVLFNYSSLLFINNHLKKLRWGQRDKALILMSDYVTGIYKSLISTSYKLFLMLIF